MKKLQNALKLNAYFSLTSGIILILLHPYIADLFGITNPMVFWIVGIGLIIFSTTVFLEAKKLRVPQIKFIVIQDLIWVIGSVALLVFQPFEISTFGNTIIAIVAVLVLGMAVNQYRGIES